jgi:TM2 domain-containing membrane protein YozV
MTTQATKNIDEKYCSSCGSIIKKEAEICPKCGVRQMPAPYPHMSGNEQGYDWLTTLLLCFFIGVVGVHRFYTGSTGIGVAQLLTLGGCGIWTLIDFITILTGSFRDGDGNPLVKRN